MGNKGRTKRTRQRRDRTASSEKSDLVQLTSPDAGNYGQAIHRLLNTGPEPCRECEAETAPGCDCDDCAQHRAEFVAFLDPGEQVTGWHCRYCGNRWARGEPHFDDGF